MSPINNKSDFWKTIAIQAIVVLLTSAAGGGVSVYVTAQIMEARIARIEQEQERMQLKQDKMNETLTEVKEGLARIEGQLRSRSYADPDGRSLNSGGSGSKERFP